MRMIWSMFLPLNSFTTSTSTSESSVGAPYAYEPNRMIRCGLNFVAMASTNSMMVLALTNDTL